MPRTDGEKTKRRILKRAEELFAEGGFDATSVDRIATSAGVNKALIYYHFKDKNDLIISLFQNIIEELGEHLQRTFEPREVVGEADLKEKIRAEIQFLAPRQRILSLMLAEALRSTDKDDYLFQCAELVMEHEEASGHARSRPRGKIQRQRLATHEFFTGFIPIIAFITLREKWCDYFGCQSGRLVEHFVEAFAQTHLASHEEAQR